MTQLHNSDPRLVVLVDRAHGKAPGRGIVMAPARGISAEVVNEMARHGRGVISACMTAERALELGLGAMTRTEWRPGMPRYLVSVEAAACTETGISAAERALTLRVLADPLSTPAHLHSPGHIMPCLAPQAGEGGLIATGLRYAASRTGVSVVAWCDILDQAGEVAPADYCVDLAHQMGATVFHLEILRQILALDSRAGPDLYRRVSAEPWERRSSVSLSGTIDADPMLSDVR